MLLFRSNNIRFRRLGRRDGLSAPVLAEFDRTEDETGSCTGMTLCLAMNYGSRQEIVDGFRAIAQRVRRGEVDPAAIDESMVSAALGTHGLPDPDLVIRTAGERRISNFLLWGSAYAELHFTRCLWPDFTVNDFHDAIAAYQHRERRFGLVPSRVAVDRGGATINTPATACPISSAGS